MQNPFLDESFGIHWSRLTHDQVEEGITACLELAQTNIDQLADGTEETLTFENTMLALETASKKLDSAWGRVDHLNSVKDSKKLREVYNKMLPKVSEFQSKIPLNAGLWKRIKAYSETAEAKTLNSVQQRYLNETLSEFKSSGADLVVDDKQRLEELQAELAKLTSKYSENCLDSVNAWEFVTGDKDELSGLPELALTQALESAKSKNLASDEEPKWRFTLQAPSLMPVLRFANNNELRKKVWSAWTSVATQDPHSNKELVGRILALRHEKAQLLGFEQFADLALELRMAKTGATAMKFEDELHLKIKSAFDSETKELEDFRAKELGIESEMLEPWNIAYWSEKYRKAKFDFDSEALRPYFPMESVLAGMYEITQKLFGVTIKEAKAIYSETPTAEDDDSGYEVWNDDVKVYEIFDDAGDHTGTFYTDWFPRESKRGGAWMNYAITGDRSKGKKEPHLGMVHGNMSPPTDGKPALLSHGDVTTVFHEFGHLIHHLFGDVEIKSLNGVNVSWDFVELPSQIMENWCWHKQGLDLFAHHYESDEVIPDDLFEKMNNARTFSAASISMRQLSLGKSDLEMHINYEKLKDNLVEELETVLEPYTAKRKTKAPINIYNFGHLFSDPMGYAAGYYSYKWAEVLDADAFTRFEKEGLLNGDTGREFKEKILSRGNSEDPHKLFVDFMGREPDPDALLRRDGLLG